MAVFNSSLTQPSEKDRALDKVSPVGGDLEGAFAAIFDMDGTLIDNTPFHFEAWQSLFKKHNMPQITKETYLSEISGVPIRNTINKYFGDLDADTLKTIIKEKREFYEDAFKPHLKPINGLESFLAELKNAGVKIAVATSSNMEDVDFIFNTIPIKKYFDAVIVGSMVNEPKPSPQIFLKAAETLGIEAQKCVVFEDSIAGLKAGNNAGMKVVGISTAHHAEKLSTMASLVINSYTDISIQKMAALFDKQ